MVLHEFLTGHADADVVALEEVHMHAMGQARCQLGSVSSQFPAGNQELLMHALP